MSMALMYSKTMTDTVSCAEKFCDLDNNTIITFQTQLGYSLPDIKKISNRLEKFCEFWNYISPHPFFNLDHIRITESGELTRKAYGNGIDILNDTHLSYITIRPINANSDFLKTTFSNIGLKHLFITTLRHKLFDINLPYTISIDTSNNGLKNVLKGNLEDFSYNIRKHITLRNGNIINGYESYYRHIILYRNYFMDYINSHNITKMYLPKE
jgi:hypothetical protein